MRQSKLFPIPFPSCPCFHAERMRKRESAFYPWQFRIKAPRHPVFVSNSLAGVHPLSFLPNLFILLIVTLGAHDRVKGGTIVVLRAVLRAQSSCSLAPCGTIQARQKLQKLRKGSLLTIMVVLPIVLPC